MNFMTAMFLVIAAVGFIGAIATYQPATYEYTLSTDPACPAGWEVVPEIPAIAVEKQIDGDYRTHVMVVACRRREKQR